MDKEELKEKLMEYSFYDEQHKLNVVLNINCLKQLFNADILLFDEKGHR